LLELLAAIHEECGQLVQAKPLRAEAAKIAGANA
jgi:hypothetical protein